jgi:O-antigen/teichoic acid export membrane protein
MRLLISSTATRSSVGEVRSHGCWGILGFPSFGAIVATSTVASQVNKQRAARDIVVQVVVRLLNLALGVVVTALVARILGSAGYGQWSAIFAILGLTGYFTNFGMERVVVREAARDPEHEHEWLGAVMMLRLVLLLPVIALSLLAILLFKESQQMLLAGVIVILAMPFDGVGAMQLIFQLRVRNTVPMIVLTLKSVLWGVAVAIIFWRGGGMVALAIAMAVTNGLGSIVQTVAALRIAGRWPRPSPKRLRPLMRAGIPLGISGMLVIGYANIDQVMVLKLAGSKAAGFYAAAYRLLEQSHFVPIAVLTTMTPIIAAAWPNDRERMMRAARTTAELMAVASLGALAFAAAAATPLILLVFGGQYTPAASALPVLFGAFVFICFGYLNGSLVTALGLQRKLLFISLSALVLNVLGNLIVVPLAGFMGAAWMTLATEVLVCGMSYRLISGELGLGRPAIGRVGRTAAAALLLFGVLSALKLASDSLVLLIPAACVCYPTLLFGLRALEPADVRVLLRRGAPA